MTIEEFYEEIGSNYNDVITRLCSKDLVKKFVLIFPTDDNFAKFSSAYERLDFDEAFRDVHTLKGLCLNLGFDRLANACIALTEALRGGKNEATPQMLDEFNNSYNEVITAIKKIS